jgi:hypothetical protein
LDIWGTRIGLSDQAHFEAYPGYKKWSFEHRGGNKYLIKNFQTNEYIDGGSASDHYKGARVLETAMTASNVEQLTWTVEFIAWAYTTPTYTIKSSTGGYLIGGRGETGSMALVMHPGPGIGYFNQWIIIPF